MVKYFPKTVNTNSPSCFPSVHVVLLNIPSDSFGIQSVCEKKKKNICPSECHRNQHTDYLVFMFLAALFRNRSLSMIRCQSHLDACTWCKHLTCVLDRNHSFSWKTQKHTSTVKFLNTKARLTSLFYKSIIKSKF